MMRVIKINRKFAQIISQLVLIASFVLAATGCHKHLGPTTIEVEDSIRHYPSVVLGDNLKMIFMVRNTGKETLVLTDIQPACPTIEVLKANTMTVPPGEEIPFVFVYHADKKIGLSRHSIRLFGNIAPNGVAELRFDTHVVRPSADMSDHEEFYRNVLRSVEEGLIDEDYGEQGYRMYD